MLERIFSSKKPVIAMVHLQYAGSMNRLISETVRDVERLERGGVDGLLFENLGENYNNRFASANTIDYVKAAMKAAANSTSLPYGLNVLPLDYEADFDIAKEVGAKFVQVDTFVDKVVTDYWNRFVIDIDPNEVISYRARLGLSRVALFTNIQTKHYTTLPANKKLETSAMQAVRNGADALIVTGKRTGLTTPKEKLIRAKKVAENMPVGAGSGATAENINEIAPCADFVIVGTGIKEGRVTGNPVDEDETKRFVEAWDRYRG